ncbi:MAG: 1-deoxy-D-xylulose-5-phosphate reductoisomerase [Gammaproteobacteria bacterium]|nr:1-deoxy-D-xylulose-5-phosphate reductoisomerase [Gammaproteobacteria bacterium]NIM73822.1 1-deoxy-D-xylulose-5-phosphate reductoisomerase [Gammaproteobacteria bacterium]NIN39399.1 1-deoxy-D-xylulose-5-phosphate reductoisomerase [Gammaproteobacteria bacterium]NIO25064.1 1-deoxy-D-xylulose-5-phosphate reductoisomerase [Gammaproteobacteria bacterium]NIO65696.1 1-deoxy-D-xylulose-5-phosphate reductoisomerase [Gammaproteobacteria bacterium]
MKRLTILGATGTIGVNTLDVVGRNPGRFEVFALTANSNDERLAEQCLEWRPRFAVMADAEGARRLRERLTGRCRETEVLDGVSGLELVSGAAEVDFVMAGIVGAAGLLPSLAAARAGKRVLLANKEALVMSGRLFMDAVRANGAELLPIDSEHNAVFQCMPPDCRGGLESAGIRRILLTASGGPFREASPEELARVTPEQACAHPNWVMGRKISVDSATMMNKGLEVIEACWLFDTTPEQVQVVVHPQSIVHSMVEYDDGSVLAQLGNPDMRTPIAHALGWPERMGSGVDSLDLAAIGDLSFEEADLERFPCLRLGFEAAAAGGAASAALNAANEVAVAAFLAGQIRFTDIAPILESSFEAQQGGEPQSLDEVLDIDAAARRHADAQVARLAA